MKFSLFCVGLFAFFVPIFQMCSGTQTLITDSYFLCYHNGTDNARLKVSNVSFVLECDRACFTFKEICFCRSSFSWRFDRYPYPLWVDMKVGDVVCKNNRVAFKSFATIDSSSTQFVIFEINEWVNKKIFDSYIQISPSKTVKVFEDITVDVAYTEFGENRFKFVFQDGYIKETTKPTCKHVYTKPGNYSLTIEVSSNHFPSFQITRTIWVVIDILNIILIPLSSSLLNPAEFYNISGFVVDGTQSQLSIKLDVGLGNPATMVALASGAISQATTACFYYCQEDMNAYIPFYSEKIYHLPYSLFQYSGFVYGLELYAIFEDPDAKFQIYRQSSDGINLVHSYNIHIQSGYNLINMIDAYLDVEVDDTIAFIIKDASIIQVLLVEGLGINIYHKANDNKLDPKNLVDSRLDNTFRLRVLTILKSWFNFVYQFNYTGQHLVFAKATTIDGGEMRSSNLKVVVKSNSPIIHNDVNQTFSINKPMNACVSIEGAVSTVITWTTSNASVFKITDNGDVIPFSNQSAILSQGMDIGALFITCVNLLFKRPGDYYLHFNITRLNIQLASKLIPLFLLPEITGLEITSPIIKNYTVYQLENIKFDGKCDDYPYDLEFTWDYGNFRRENVSRKDFEFEHSYSYVGKYEVILSANYRQAREVRTMHVNVRNSFQIITPLTADVNVETNIVVFAFMKINSSWTSRLEISDGKFVNITKFPFSLPYRYQKSGNIEVSLVINTNLGPFRETLVVRVTEPIIGLKIQKTDDGQKTFVGVNFTMEAVHDNGDNLTYAWFSKDLTIVSLNGSQVTVWSDAEGKHELSVFAKNDHFSGNRSVELTLTNAITKFVVIPSTLFVAPGGLVSFDVICEGKVNRFYEMTAKHSENEGNDTSKTEEISTVNTQINKRFHLFGIYQVYFSILIGDLTTQCYDLAVAPCIVSVNITVQHAIKDLHLTYTDKQLEAKNNNIYSLTQQELIIDLTVLNGSDVKFSMMIDGKEIRGILGIPKPTYYITTARLPLSYVNFWTRGVYQCEVIVLNHVSKIAKNYKIVINDAVSNVSLIIPQFIETNNPFLVNSMKDMGSGALYEWRVNNISFGGLQNSFLKTSISQVGNYTISLRVFNPSSEEVVKASVVVIQSISQPHVKCGDAATTPGELIVLRFGYDKGDFVSVNYTENDGPSMSLSYSEFGKVEKYYTAVFDIPATYLLNVTFENPVGISAWKTCKVKVERVIDSVSISIMNSEVYVGSTVRFWLIAYGGTDIEGQIFIQTQSSITIDTEDISFDNCDVPNCMDGVASHKFKAGNNYRITGVIKNSVSSVIVKPTDVLVIGTPKNSEKLVKLVAESALLGDVTKVYLLKDWYVQLTTCTLMYGDGQKLETTKFPKVFNHTYHKVGKFDINIHCSSDHGSLSFQTEAVVQMQIIISNIIYPEICTLFGSQIEISIKLSNILMTHGAWVEIYANDTKLDFGNLVSDGVTLKINILVPIAGEKLPFEVLVKNYESEVSETFELCVNKPITSISCLIPSAWRLGTSTPFRVRVESGSSVELTIIYGDGLSLKMDSYLGKELSNMHQYNNTDNFNYTVKVSNKVSILWCNSSIDIIDPLPNVSLIHKKIIEWPIKHAEFTLQFNKAVPPKLYITYELHFGDGNISKSLALDLSTMKDNGIFIKLHEYQNPGCYNPILVLSDKINSVIVKSKIYLTNFDMLLPVISSTSPMVASQKNFFPDDFPLQIMIKNSMYTCFEYHLDLYEGSNVLVTMVTKNSSINLLGLLNKPGRYVIVLNASLGNETKQISNSSIVLLKGLTSLWLEFRKQSDLKEIELIVITRNAVNYYNLSIAFGDNTNYTVNAPQFTLEKHDRYVFKQKHSYEKPGTYKVTVSCENQVSRTEAIRNVFISDEQCERPTVRILSADNKRLEFYYSKPIFIQATMSTDCGRASKLLFSWQVFSTTLWQINNEVSSGGKKKLSLPKTDTSQSSLYIASRSLKAGFYIVKLNIEMEANQLDESREVYLIIIEQQLQVKISGGSSLKLPYTEDVVLDASKSTDPNEVTAQLQYEWHCKMPKGSGDGHQSCFGNDADNDYDYYGEIWVIPKKVLFAGVPYLFGVVVKNAEKQREASSNQSIILLDEEIPILSISCQSNCGTVNPTRRFALSAHCSNCGYHPETTYKWSVTEIRDDPTPIILEHTGSPALVVQGNTLRGNAEYRLSLTVTIKSGASSSSTYEIKTLPPPSGGSCQVFPKIGFALKTLFTIKCKDWITPYNTLQYRVFSTGSDDDKEQKLLHYGPESTFSLFLSRGISNDNSVMIVLEVADLLGVSTKIPLLVRVNPLFVTTNVDDVHDELLKLTTGDGNDARKLLNEGNTQQSLQMIKTISSMLNIPDENRNKAKDLSIRTNIRSGVAETLSHMNIQSYDTLRQTSDILFLNVQRIDEISNDTQKHSMRLLENMNDFLKTYPESEDPEIVQQSTVGLIKGGMKLLNLTVSIGVMRKELNEATKEKLNMTAADNKTETDPGQEYVGLIVDILDTVADKMLSGMIVAEEPLRISNEDFSLHLSRQSANEIKASHIKTVEGGKLQLPRNMFEFESNDTAVKSKLMSLLHNPFYWKGSTTVNVNLPVTSLSYSKDNSEKVKVDNLPEGQEIELFILNDFSESEMVVVNASLLYEEKLLIVYRLSINQDGVSLLSYIDCPRNMFLQIYFSRGARPTLSRYDESLLIDCSLNTSLNMFSTLSNISVYYIGLRISNVSLQQEDPHNFHTVERNDSVVKLGMSIVGCLFLDEVEQKWTNTGCKVGKKTTLSTIHCLCNHLTWLGSGFFIPPNKLDIEAELLKLKSLDDYPALLSTFCTILGVSLICMIWARRKDNLDLRKSEPVYLKSQSTSHGTTYHIAIYTGHRGSSGTTAIPTLILSGGTLDSNPITLKSDDRKLFDRGTVETFLYTTKKKLGDLKYVTIWHDDTGKYPAWYLSRMTITNMNTEQQYHCFCNNWLAVDQSDGRIDRVLPIATEKEMTAFENIFLARTARDLTDGHIWFSIITRPPRSNFTRLQRVVCCLTLLLSTMLTNAMFYRTPAGTKAGDEIDISGFKIKWSNILIGIQSALIVLPVNIFIVYLFRRGRPSGLNKKAQKESIKLAADVIFSRAEHSTTLLERTEQSVEFIGTEHVTKQNISIPINNTVSKSLNSFGSSSIFDIKQEVKLEDVNLSHRTFTDKSDHGQGKSLKVKDKILQDPNKPQDDTKSLHEDIIRQLLFFQLEDVKYWPHWVIYIAWILCFIVSSVAGFFTLLYGLSFGKVGQEQWLFSFFVSVFADIMFNQPIKVVIFAAIVTLIIRKLKDDYILAEIGNFRDIDWGDDELDHTQDSIELGQDDGSKRPKPPTKSYIEMTRRNRIYETKMVDVVIEIVAYSFYLFLCLLITYGHRDPDAYSMTENIENIFYVNKFEKVNSIPKFWNWSLNVLSPGLFNDDWYNGKIMENKGFLSDGATFLLGATRIRQVRVKKEPCLADGHFGLNISSCGWPYSRSREETRSNFCDMWKECSPFAKRIINDNIFSFYPQIWNYVSSSDSGSYITTGRVNSYTGGGYVVDIGKVKINTDNLLHYMMQTNWLDDFTRVVFVDFTVYNTNANFYVMVTFLLEIPPNGGAFVFKRILTTRLDRYSSGFAVFLGACEVLFLAFSTYYMYREIKKFSILRWRYFRRLMNWIEVINFGFIWTTFGLLIVRFGVVSKVKSKYFDNPYSFTNFEIAGISDQAYGYFLASVVTILFIKFLKLLRFNRKITLMFKTLSHGSQDLCYFSITLAITVFAYTQATHLIYASHVEGYSTLIYSFESLFSLVLGRFNYRDLTYNHPILGNMFFISYILTLTWILLNMFISIINHSFSKVEDSLKGKANKYELVDFLKQRFGGFLPAFLTRKKFPKAVLDESKKKKKKEVTIQSGKTVQSGDTAQGSKIAQKENMSTKMISVNSTRTKELEKRIKQTELTVKALNKAVDCISERVQHMFHEERHEQTMWKYVAELLWIKFPQI